jgi:hypothetical protein
MAISRFALDVLAIPAMTTDCKTAFSLAKLTVISSTTVDQVSWKCN